MEKKQKSELTSRFQDLKREISNLRNKLDDLNVEKEKWFNAKEDLKKKVSELIKSIKELKSKNDSFNINVEKLKKDRNSNNNKVKDLINNVKRLGIEKSEIFKKSGIKEDPSRIKERINKLELSIETEGFSFSKEKKVMDEIKKFKRILSEASGAADISNKMNKISKEIDETRDKAEESHNELQQCINENKDKYDEFIRLSKQINESRSKQEEAFKRFLELKKEFSLTNNLLKEKLLEANVIGANIEEHKIELQEKRKLREEKVLEEMAKEVEEKLRLGKKLTTQDLIIMQGKGV